MSWRLDERRGLSGIQEHESRDKGEQTAHEIDDKRMTDIVCFRLVAFQIVVFVLQSSLLYMHAIEQRQ